MNRPDQVTARRAELSEIFELRWEVLRPGATRESAMFPGDDAPETLHVGAFDAGGRNICCATGNRNEWEGTPAWQLRGMAVADDWQRRGVGQLTLAKLVELARGAWGVGLMWCNARENAVAFYEAQGWRIASERFMIEGVCMHYKMVVTI